MSRRHAPTVRWHVGDRCQVAEEVRMGYPPSPTRTMWSRVGEVVAVRGDRVVVRHHRWEREHPWWELRVPPKPRRYCRWRRGS